MVYKARQPQLNRIVALKILSPALSGDPAFAERFSREALSLARLNHSNIVSVFDFGRAGNFYYLLMEYVDGANLHDLIQANRPGPDEARRIAVEICRALEFAHEEGVIHRDIKPSNVLIDNRGRVKIADFGLAKLTGTEPERSRLTTAVMGTPHYMAPEQVEKPALVDERADLFSLGVICYEMLTGELPLGRFAMPAEQNPAVDTRLNDSVLRALEKDPGRRFQTAGELRAALETTMAAKAPGGTRWSFLRQFALWAGVAMVAVFSYVLLKDHWPWKHNRPKSPPIQANLNAASEALPVGARVASALHLDKTQAMELNRLVRRYQREFAGVEARHSEHHKDAAGHVHITVNPFPEDMKQLMDGMWRDMAGFLTPTQLEAAHRLDFERFFSQQRQGHVTGGDLAGSERGGTLCGIGRAWRGERQCRVEASPAQIQVILAGAAVI